MSRIQNVSRRDFLQGVLSGGAFVLGACLSRRVVWAAAAVSTPADRATFHPDIFLGIEMDGTVLSLPTARKWATAAVRPYLVSWRTS